MRAAVTVIGVGNPYRGDDAAGLEVARRVAAVAPAGVTVHEHDGEPAGLLDRWQGADLAFVVDAVRSGAEPGTVHRVEVGGGGVPAVPRRDSSHALGLGDAVELARTLDRLPGRLVLIGIEGADFAAGEGLSAGVGEAVERVAEDLVHEVGEEAAR